MVKIITMVEELPISEREIKFNKKHILGIRYLTRNEIITIVETAAAFTRVLERRIKTTPTLKGKIVANLFYEPSTRTRISFETAAKALSANVINVSVSTSSVRKGESLLDTIKTLEAIGADIIIIRHSSPGAANFVAEHFSGSVINAGDGATEHPSQALLDLLTIYSKFGDFSKRKIVIVGDILNSRVARSHFWMALKLGWEISVVCPETFFPPQMKEAFPWVNHYVRIEDAIEGADIVMALRIQKERKSGLYYPSDFEYASFWQIDKELLEYRDILLMHPGPVNRGVELSSDVVYSENSLILDQVKAGVALRMGLLYLVSKHLRGMSKDDKDNS